MSVFKKGMVVQLCAPYCAEANTSVVVTDPESSFDGCFAGIVIKSTDPRSPAGYETSRWSIRMFYHFSGQLDLEDVKYEVDPNPKGVLSGG